MSFRNRRFPQTAIYGAAAADAAQTTAFLARTSGLSGTETAAYKALINGLVADGAWALLDALYIFATNTNTTANLNLISTSFTLTPTNTPAFAADVGYTCDGTTSYLDTGLITGTNYTQNSASLGMAVQTNDTSSATKFEMGVYETTISLLGSNYNLTTIYSIHEAGFNQPASTTSKGMWSASRTSSSSVSVYSNGSATPVNTAATSSNGVNTKSIWIGGLNNSGALLNGSDRQISAVWIGGGLTGTQYSSMSARINAYLTALGMPVY